jgi:23S rRNA (uridine2552-2'-O)-methyltransferase
VLAELEAALENRPVDLVVSDMSPNLSGVASADQARSMYLCELALDFSSKHLKKNGNMAIKVFQGAGFPEFLQAMRSSFKTVVSRKPDASKGRSSETYLVGKGLK